MDIHAKTMKDALGELAMRLLPKTALSRLVGRLVHRPLPQPLGRLSVEWFARRYRIDLSEAELPLSSYRTIGELFTRRLKPGLRPIGEGVVHPADSLITQAGRVEAGTLIQAKGLTYTAARLLGTARFSARLEGGTFCTYYLCPTDYHRVHAPVDGRIVWGARIPGALWPVNAASAGRVDGLFVKNERVIAILETARGLAAFVMVAATNVGDIVMAFDAALGGGGAAERAYEPGIPVRRGEELGVFKMGSTVVMLYEKGVLDAAPDALRGRRVKMGSSADSGA